MPYGVQLSSLMIMVAIVASYYVARRPRLMFFIVFESMMFIALANIILDIACAYMLAHLDIFSEAAVKTFYILFLVSVALVFFLFALYIGVRGRMISTPNKGVVLFTFLFPFAFAAVAYLLPVEYHVDVTGSYTSGAAVYFLYSVIVLSIIANFVQIIIYRKTIEKNELMAMVGATLMLLAFTVLEFIFPEFLFSSVGFTILVLLCYISMVNPRELYDQRLSNMLNTGAFQNVLRELYGRKNEFYVVTMVISNFRQLRNEITYDSIMEMVRNIGDILRKETGQLVYNLDSQDIAIVFPSKAAFAKFDKRKNLIRKMIHEAEIRYSPQYFFSIIEAPKFASDMDEMIGIIEFCRREGRKRGEQFFVEVDEEIVKQKDYQANVEKLVADSIKNDGFEVFYQPILDTRTGRFAFAEALVRLKDTQTLGFVSPEIFIPLAEQRGMIRELGATVFRKVCEFFERERLDQMGVRAIDVNLSAIQAVDDKFPEFALACMDKHGISPEMITFEITETASVDLGDLFFENMSRLTSGGSQLSMDDFGSGYSNFVQLSNTGFNIIKLDKSIVWSAFGFGPYSSEEPVEERSVVVLESCIGMIKGLGRRIVAEGIETEEMVNFLKAHGVDQLQGYYYSRPLPEKDYVAFLKKHMKTEDKFRGIMTKAAYVVDNPFEYAAKM